MNHSLKKDVDFPLFVTFQQQHLILALIRKSSVQLNNMSLAISNGGI